MHNEGEGLSDDSYGSGKFNCLIYVEGEVE